MPLWHSVERHRCGFTYLIFLLLLLVFASGIEYNSPIFFKRWKNIKNIPYCLSEANFKAVVEIKKKSVAGSMLWSKAK